jgi:hypothetical protein
VECAERGNDVADKEWASSDHGEGRRGLSDCEGGTVCGAVGRPPVMTIVICFSNNDDRDVTQVLQCRARTDGWRRKCRTYVWFLIW